MYQMELVTVAMTEFVEVKYTQDNWMESTWLPDQEQQGTHQLDHTYSMWQSPSWEANRSSGRQEIPGILWKTTVHYCIHNSLPPDTVLSQFNPVHAPLSNFLNINFNISSIYT